MNIFFSRPYLTRPRPEASTWACRAAPSPSFSARAFPASRQSGPGIGWVKLAEFWIRCSAIVSVKRSEIVFRFNDGERDFIRPFYSSEPEPFYMLKWSRSLTKPGWLRNTAAFYHRYSLSILLIDMCTLLIHLFHFLLQLDQEFCTTICILLGNSLFINLVFFAPALKIPKLSLNTKLNLRHVK